MLVEHQKGKRKERRDLEPKFDKELHKKDEVVRKATGYEEIHKEEHMYTNKGVHVVQDPDFDDDFM